MLLQQFQLIVYRIKKPDKNVSLKSSPKPRNVEFHSTAGLILTYRNNLEQFRKNKIKKYKK